MKESVQEMWLWYKFKKGDLHKEKEIWMIVVGILARTEEGDGVFMHMPSSKCRVFEAEPDGIDENDEMCYKIKTLDHKIWGDKLSKEIRCRIEDERNDFEITMTPPDVIQLEKWEEKDE